ncbi:CocE/NonD family hydrolase [Chryseobacterium wanjuense]
MQVVMIKALGKRAVAYNYIGVVVNTRGKRTSSDNIEPFEHESNDLYEVIDWISKQKWCNGKVGMIGEVIWVSANGRQQKNASCAENYCATGRCRYRNRLSDE